MSNKANGPQIRSQAEWIEQGERNAGYFTRLEKQRQAFNRIDCIRNDDGELLTGNDEVLNEGVKFYSKLFSSQSPNNDDIDDYLMNTDMANTLNVEDKNICEGLINNIECEQAIKGLKYNKSPGLDGLTNEFYKKFTPH